MQVQQYSTTKYSIPYTRLTNNIQVYWVGSGYPGWNLALINAGIALLNIFDDQGPFVCVRIVSGQKSLISSVGIFPNRQDMNITMADPGHLQKKIKKNVKRERKKIFRDQMLFLFPDFYLLLFREFLGGDQNRKKLYQLLG